MLHPDYGRIPGSRCRAPRNDEIGSSQRARITREPLQRDRFCSRKFSAVAAKTCMLASRSALPVSSVIADGSPRPATADAAMAGGVAIAVAGRAGRAGLGQAPVGGETAANLARQQFCVGLGGRADSLHRVVGDVHQNPPRIAGIDHGGAEEIGRGAGHREQRGRDQAAGRGFRDRDGLAPLDQPGGYLLGDRNQIFHRVPFLASGIKATTSPPPRAFRFPSTGWIGCRVASRRRACFNAASEPGAACKMP